MARKFNIGRQNEQLLNEELHSLFMSLKYLNYNRYKGLEELFQEHQTEIPSHALRLKSQDGIDKIEVHYPGSDDDWRPIFEGYYHPINTKKPAPNAYVSAYQLCIDPETGAIMYWDAGNMCWTVARANEYTGELHTFNGLNFQYIKDLTETNGFYPVPYVYYGKLFSDAVLIPFNEYTNENDCAISDVKTTNNSWVHVNASKLVNINKRLIKVQTDKSLIDYGFIGVTSNQTEFYSFDGESKYGKLLKKDDDYVDTIGGITLLDPDKHKFIYTLTYDFENYPYTEGVLFRKTDTVGQRNEIYVGQTTETISLFIDGLSLEETDEEGNPLYLYDRDEGTVIFTDDDDAEILNNMQMTTIMFPRKTEEISLSTNSNSDNIVIAHDKVAIKMDVGNNIQSFNTPMVFCSGLGLQETNIFEDVVINTNNTIIINNFVMAENEVYKMFVADVGDSFICKGTLSGSDIIDDKIKDDTNYIVFINGILMTPTNGDISVTNGRITVTDAENSRFDTLDYVVFEMDDADDNKMGLVFDDMVTSYAIRIDDNGENATYDNCNSALVYLETEDGAGILLDEDSVAKPIHALEGYYKGGQIVRVADHYGNYEYYIYDYTLEEPRKMEESEIEEVSGLFGYYATKGSIHLLDNSNSFAGGKLTYYAYSFANTIDEVAIMGVKDDLVIPAGNRICTYNGSAKRLEAWRAGCNALSTYINGLIIENNEENVSEGLTRYYSIQYPSMKMNFNKNYYDMFTLVEDIDQELINILNAIYQKYYLFKIEDLLIRDILNETVNLNNGYTYKIKDIFKTTSIFAEAFALAKYINEDMTRERTSYVIEEIEKNEFLSAFKDYIHLETGNNDTKHAQIYQIATDTIEADFLLAPGYANVYVNGVRLEDSEYCRFDNNKIMFDINVCGIQDLPVHERMIRNLPDHLNKLKITDDAQSDFEYYSELLKQPQVMRIIEDKIYYIPVSSRDTILVEKREDTSIKKTTFDVLISSYNTLDFNQDYYDIPQSLLTSGDLIKIYINGVFYDGGYTISNNGGIRGIKLTDPDALKIDPLYEHFNRYPDDLEAYKIKYNKDYKRQIDRITFEWR